jgi:hypothetical protein
VAILLVGAGLVVALTRIFLSASLPPSATAVADQSGTSGIVTALDIPMPDGYRIEGQADLARTSLAPSDALEAARAAYPTSVGNDAVVRFLTVSRSDRGVASESHPTWVVVSRAASFPTFGDARSNAGNAPAFRETYGWVFVDSSGQAVGAMVLGYRDEAPPPLPAT